ncbi:MAG: Dabb family protein [Clostridia bacterium]|nr:Dabb family protein [Clostridia bacterium]
MVKHVIIWSFTKEYSETEKAEFADKIKLGLEGLLGKIDGLTEIKVYTNPLESSTGDLMLDSTFKDEAALKAYQSNPHHLEVATFVRSVVDERKCFDFEL